MNIWQKKELPGKRKWKNRAQRTKEAQKPWRHFKWGWGLVEHLFWQSMGEQERKQSGEGNWRPSLKWARIPKHFPGWRWTRSGTDHRNHGQDLINNFKLSNWFLMDPIPKQKNRHKNFLEKYIVILNLKSFL